MKKIAFVFIFILFTACKTEHSNKPSLIGVWIPQIINWKDGNFNTLYFYNDTSLLILSSTQKYLNDSIFFQAEPGFVLKYGTVISSDSSKAEINSQVLYRFITLPGDNTPSAIVNESLSLVTKDKNVASFEYQCLRYVRTNRYTNQSVKNIKDIATKMVPDLKKEYGIK
jgi:hypothetical protein